ncbi:hypothetical protein HUK80_01010 [Flavobacterium sp. MAH-1]|uniref:DUF3575 domain-containing protein n=1 Tax=Flavobacterium agri TaxID=2743471 RepID=A0A7Y9C5L2_9FLAO|nr:hypothetical protein [Flavobacterium agri]NUY79458.1 hypothetical protein [Flavobacterium agri]NYA69483.1 hypothetical protein [Flavobacterium agri]
MKKVLIFAAFVATSVGFAQSTTTTTTTTNVDGKTHTASETTTYDKKVTVSAFGSFPELNQVGVSVEFLGNQKTKSMDAKSFSFYSSKIVNVAYGMMKYDVNVPAVDDIDGQGFVVELGQRTYFLGKNSGPYLGNFLSYGRISYDDDFGVFGDDGTYSYFSFFSPEAGYKIKAGPVAIDPFVGIMWKLEIKGQGYIDNKNVEEWVPRVGLKIGYEF